MKNEMNLELALLYARRALVNVAPATEDEIEKRRAAYNFLADIHQRTSGNVIRGPKSTTPEFNILGC